MKLVKVASGVVNQTPLAWEQNKRNILDAIAAAREQGASILCLPELCISGYGCEDAFHSRGLQATALCVLEEILPATEGMIVSLGLPLLFQNALFNTVCLVADRQILGFVAKQHLPGEGLHYEPRWFKAWPKGQHVEVVVEGRPYPLGDIHFDCGGVKIGFEICEDAWVANRTGGGLSLEGVDIILNPSASHFAFAKREVRRRLVLEGSRAFGVTYIYSSPVGNEAGRIIYEGGAMIASAGKLLAHGPRFSFANCHVTSAVVDIDATRMYQARSTSFVPDVGGRSDSRSSIDSRTDMGARKDSRTSIGGVSGLVCADFGFPELDPVEDSPVTQSGEPDVDAKEEEFTRAVALALFDYLRKSRSHGFVVSLSGGADSATCACLVSLMVELGVAELGRDGFVAKLSYLHEIQQCKTAPEIIRQLLLCVYQSTKNSSHTTRDAARRIAEGVGARFIELDVDGLVSDYVTMVSRAVGRELSWDTDDIALQNIQARTRAPGVWMMANLRQALLLCTSNRSEAAVGYATMDGDTSGGLSPIAGIDKAFLRHWLRWLEHKGPRGLHPIPALAAVNRQQPTAELRPLESGQTDEDDLMPYDLLDAVERGAIRDKLTPLEVFRRIRPQFSQYDVPQLGVWVERFFTLWSRNQWKRERYAPSFHVDDENLDPKTWCRFPILSGGFERELQELRDYLARS